MVTAEGGVRSRSHLAGLDGVRGLAILLVLAIHFLGMRTPQGRGQYLLVKAAGYGMLGVDLFFVLSGFLITGLLLDGRTEPRPLRNFYARRVLRIFPLYFGVLVACFLVLPLSISFPPAFAAVRTHQVWLWTFTSNLFTAIHGSWTSLNYLSHFWSLAIEEHYYLLWPLVVLAVQPRTLERISIGVVAGALLLRIGLALGGMSELSISVLTPCRIDTLSAGGLLALWARRPSGLAPLVERSGRAALGLGALVLLLSLWCSVIALGLPVLHQIRNSLYALLFAALLLVSLGPRSSPVARAFQSPVLGFFGKYSYGLYVYSGIWTWIFLEKDLDGRLDALLGNHALTIAVHGALGVTLSLLIAVASYQLYERHFLALKRYFGGTADRPGGAQAVHGEPVAAPAGLTPGTEPPR